MCPKADVRYPASGPGPAKTRAGIAVIVASGLYIIHRKRIVARSPAGKAPARDSIRVRRKPHRG